MTPFETVRAQEYPELDGIFFNAASWGLMPRRAAEAVADLTRRRNQGQGFREEEFSLILDRARTAAASLVGADPHEIALSPNTSYGVNLAAACVAQGPPGAIVVSAGEFPANVFPWLALEPRGFRVEVVPPLADGWPDEEALLAALGREDVRALALSHVQFATGHRADLERFGGACRERGILFAVDAIQGLGAVPLDVRSAGIHLLSCGGQKWLCAPCGSGFSFVDRRLTEGFDPPMVSWLAMEGADEFSSLSGYHWRLLKDARRFKLATLGLQDYLGLALSVELILELGPERIQEHLFSVHAPLLEWADSRPDVTLVSPRDPARRAGIVSFRPPARARPGCGRLGERGSELCRSRRVGPLLSALLQQRERDAGCGGDPGAHGLTRAAGLVGQLLTAAGI